MKLPGRRGKGRPQRRFNRCIEGGNVGVTEERSAVATSKGSSQKKSWLPITDSIRRQINVHLTNSAEKRHLFNNPYFTVLHLSAVLVTVFFCFCNILCLNPFFLLVLICLGFLSKAGAGNSRPQGVLQVLNVSLIQHRSFK